MNLPTPLARLLGPLFTAFEQEGVRYCVLRGYAGLPDETRNDVDLAIEAAATHSAEEIVRRVCGETENKTKIK